MFAALAADGVNMKMITTGDIKISVLIEEDDQAADDLRPATWRREDQEGAPGIAESGPRAEGAACGSRGVRAGRAAQGGRRSARARRRERLQAAAEPACWCPAAKDREAAIARLEGMEDVLVSGVHLNADQSRITIHDLPDQPGNCSKVFNAVATGGILVDMIVQNLTAPGRAELSFTVPRADLTRALKRTQDVVRRSTPGAAWSATRDIAVLFVLGVGMRTHTGVARTMFGALAARGINIGMINTSEVCVERGRGDGPAARKP